MKEQRIYDRVRELGHEPIEGTAIIVSRTPDGILQAAIEFAMQTDRFELLVCCTDAVLIFRLDNLANGIRTSAPALVIPRDGIRAASVTTADAGMTRRIRIVTDSEEILLNAQHETTSAVRTSGLWGAWHAANLPRTCDEISHMGTAAHDAPAKEAM